MCICSVCARVGGCVGVCMRSSPSLRALQDEGREDVRKERIVADGMRVDDGSLGNHWRRRNRTTATCAAT